MACSVDRGFSSPQTVVPSSSQRSLFRRGGAQASRPPVPTEFQTTPLKATPLSPTLISYDANARSPIVQLVARLARLPG